MATTIIPRNQVLKVTPYSPYHLPPLVPGTAGMAQPKASARAVVCIAPGNAKAHNPHWQQELDIHSGDPHQAIARDDTYPNQAFARDYTVYAAVAASDPLALVLKDFWMSRGFNEQTLKEAWLTYLGGFRKRKPPWWRRVRQSVEGGAVFFEAKKDREVVVMGVVDLRITTSEGPTTLEHGSVLLQHPDDASNQWLARAEKFAERYNWTRSPKNGLLIPQAR
jgi:hypothetical protein